MEFSIQSVSKLFVFALVCDALGHEEARRKLGVNSTGLPFNSVMAIELNADRTMNPLVNAGAMATTSLVPGTTADEKFDTIVTGLSRFAGRQLVMDHQVYESEATTNFHNQGIARLLDGYGRMYCDPDVATDVYTRQCALRVSARDLAVMGATLAGGGVNPLTGLRAIDAGHCKRVLAVLATAGLYEHSGDWLYDVGLPGKSGVSGGIVTVSPGKGGLGTYSPPLDGGGQRSRAIRHQRPLRSARTQPFRICSHRVSTAHPKSEQLGSSSPRRATAPTRAQPRLLLLYGHPDLVRRETHKADRVTYGHGVTFRVS